MSPLQILTPLMKVTGDPYWEGQVSPVRRERHGCLRTGCQSAIPLTGRSMGSVMHRTAGGQGEVLRNHNICRAVTQLTALFTACPHWCKYILILFDHCPIWKTKQTKTLFAIFIGYVPCSTMFVEHWIERPTLMWLLRWIKVVMSTQPM